jgi:hypothetical protein
LLRHANHIREVETVAIETLERLLAQQESNFEALPSGLSKNYQSQAKEKLAFQLQIMKGLRARAGAAQERLMAEINLVSELTMQ